MTVQNWGNNDPSRQLQQPPVPASAPLNYFKLYLTIVGAIITAFFIMAVFSFMFSAALFNALMSDLSSTKRAVSHPTQQHSSGLQKDIQQLATKSIQQVAAPIQQRAEQLTKQAKQQSSAKSSDMQTCIFWQQQYNKEKSDRNKMHVNSSCERAHGKLWQRIN